MFSCQTELAEPNSTVFQTGKNYKQLFTKKFYILEKYEKIDL